MRPVPTRRRPGPCTAPARPHVLARRGGRLAPLPPGLARAPRAGGWPESAIARTDRPGGLPAGDQTTRRRLPGRVPPPPALGGPVARRTAALPAGARTV